MRLKARNLPDRSVEDIQKEVTAAARAQAGLPASVGPADNHAIPSESPNMDYVEEPIDIVPGLVDVSSLMTLDGPAFLRAAYRSVLCREIDQDGEDVYGNHLQKGMHRLEILIRLRVSAEGRKCHARFTGGVSSWIDLAFARIPVFGYVYSVMRDVLLMPRKLRRMELRLAAIEDRLRRKQG